MDFRPIALSSCVLKLLEKLIKSRLDRVVELDLLLPSQFGFCKGRSCDDCFALLMLEVYRGFINHNPMGALFLDIKGPYDNVKPNILLDIVNSIRIPVDYKSFIGNLINHRYVNFYESDKFCDSRTIFKGLPQRSSLSRLLFNLFIILKIFWNMFRMIAKRFRLPMIFCFCAHIITKLLIAYKQLLIKSKYGLRLLVWNFLWLNLNL